MAEAIKFTIEIIQGCVQTYDDFHELKDVCRSFRIILISTGYALEDLHTSLTEFPEQHRNTSFAEHLDQLRAAIKTGERVLNACSGNKKNKLKIVILSRDYTRKLKAASDQITSIVANITASQASSMSQIKANLDRLIESTGHELHDKLKKEIRSDSIWLREQLLLELKSAGIVKDSLDLERQLEDFWKNKEEIWNEKIEAYDDELVQMVKDVSEGNPGVKKSLLCPISKDTMEDPVLLVESSITYDNKNICTWLLDNPDREPTTGVRYDKPLTLSKNMNLRAILQDVYTESKYVPYDDSGFALEYRNAWLDSRANIVPVSHSSMKPEDGSCTTDENQAYTDRKWRYICAGIIFCVSVAFGVGMVMIFTMRSGEKPDVGPGNPGGSTLELPTSSEGNQSSVSRQTLTPVTPATPSPQIWSTPQPTPPPTTPPPATGSTPPPTPRPTLLSTPGPTPSPSLGPAQPPTLPPVLGPTMPPTSGPTQLPTMLPTMQPSQNPSPAPTRFPTRSPTRPPTLLPTKLPTRPPTRFPTNSPTPPLTSPPTSMPPISAPAPTSTPTPNPLTWNRLGNDIDADAFVDEFGASVSLSADGLTIAIGAYRSNKNGNDSGHASVYRLNGSGWTQLGEDILGQYAGDWCGRSVSLSADGSIVAVGSPNNNDNGGHSGHVRVFRYDGGNGWTQMGNAIAGKASDDWSGYTCALSSNGLVVATGSRYSGINGFNSGRVDVFAYSGSGQWIQRGAMIAGRGTHQEFGRKVSLSADGSVVAGGARHNNDNGKDAGHVRIFEFDSSLGWLQRGFDIQGEAAFDQIGDSFSLSADGSVIAIGGLFNDGNGIDSGHVRVFEFNDFREWIQRGEDIEGEQPGDQSGSDVFLSSDGSTVAVNSLHNSDNGLNAGHVRVFEYKNNGWRKRGDSIDGENPGDKSGRSVALSSDGSIVATSSHFKDGSALGFGHVRVFRYSAADS